MAVPLEKFQAVRLQLTTAHFAKPFKSNFWELWSFRRAQWSELDVTISILRTGKMYCRYWSFLQLWGKTKEMLPCDHEQSTLDVLRNADTTLVQGHNIDVAEMLFDFSVSTLYPTFSLQHRWHVLIEAKFPRRCKCDIVVSMLRRRRFEYNIHSIL